MTSTAPHNQNGADSREEVPAPISCGQETTQLYHASVPSDRKVQCFYGQELTSDETYALYEHLGAVREILGMEWKHDQPLEGGIQGLYVRRDQKDATLFTGTHLPESLSGNGAETELVILARAIALHLSSIAFNVCENVQAAWTWEDPTKGICMNTCQVEESLNPCAACRLKSACALGVRKQEAA